MDSSIDWSPQYVQDLMSESKDSKLRLAWPDGGGESVWVAVPDELDGLAIINNNPLYPKYKYMDVVRINGTEAGEVVYRPYPVTFRFFYKADDGEGSSRAQAKVLMEALKPFDGNPSLFVPGNGHIDLLEGAVVKDVMDALLKTDLKFEWMAVQHFDVETDEYEFDTVYGEEPE